MAANRTSWMFQDERSRKVRDAQNQAYADRLDRLDVTFENMAETLFSDFCAERGIDPADLADVDIDDEELDSFYW